MFCSSFKLVFRGITSEICEPVGCLTFLKGGACPGTSSDVCWNTITVAFLAEKPGILKNKIKINEFSLSADSCTGSAESWAAKPGRTHLPPGREKLSDEYKIDNTPALHGWDRTSLWSTASSLTRWQQDSNESNPNSKAKSAELAKGAVQTTGKSRAGHVAGRAVEMNT